LCRDPALLSVTIGTPNNGDHVGLAFSACGWYSTAPPVLQATVTVGSASFPGDPVVPPDSSLYNWQFNFGFPPKTSGQGTLLVQALDNGGNEIARDTRNIFIP
jgi:hypothetical protein